MKTTTIDMTMKQKFPLLLAALGLCALVLTGCGTNSNLAGLAVGVNVAQKGMVAGLTVQGGSNAVNVGVSYAQGSNSYNVGATIPLSTSTNK